MVTWGGWLKGVLCHCHASAVDVQVRSDAGAQDLDPRPRSASFDLVSLHRFSEDQVAEWVAAIPRLRQFAPLFKKHQIVGSVFLRLDNEMLKEIGIDCAPSLASSSTQLGTRGIATQLSW